MNDLDAKLIRWQLRRGCGKANVELQRITSLDAKRLHQRHLAIISREEIERQDFSRIRNLFCLSADPVKLRPMLGKTTFAVSNYEDHDDELFEITEVREFFHHMNCHYPCWVAASDLDSGVLRVIAACVSTNLYAVRETTWNHTAIHIPRDNVTKFFINAMPLTGAIHQVADISPSRGRKRLDLAAKHLGL